jgi:hypothetical protein
MLIRILLVDRNVVVLQKIGNLGVREASNLIPRIRFFPISEAYECAECANLLLIFAHLLCSMCRYLCRMAHFSSMNKCIELWAESWADQ